VTFDKAEVGELYTLEIGVDDAYVNPYSANTYNTYVVSIQRVKWNKLGLCEFNDTFMSQTWSYYAEIEQRDGTNTFRILNPYAGGNNNAEDWAGTLSQSTDKIIFTVLEKTESKDADGDTYYYVTFDSWETGYWYEDAYMVWAFLPSELSSSLAADDELSVYYPDYGQVILTPYYYIPGLGGFGENPVYITLPSDNTPAEAVAGGIVPSVEE